MPDSSEQVAGYLQALFERIAVVQDMDLWIETRLKHGSVLGHRRRIHLHTSHRTASVHLHI